VDALGAFTVPLNVRYGQNPYDLVMYGPAGEVVRESRTVRVPFSRLPDGRSSTRSPSASAATSPATGS